MDQFYLFTQYNPSTKNMTLINNVPYGVAADMPFYVENMLEELDEEVCLLYIDIYIYCGNMGLYAPRRLCFFSCVKSLVLVPSKGRGI